MSPSLFTPPATSPVYRRWTKDGMVEAQEAKGFSVPADPSFEGARLFTARELGTDGVLYFRAYEAHSGMAFGEHHLKRNVCEDEARRFLKRTGRDELEAKVAEAIDGRSEK